MRRFVFAGLFFLIARPAMSQAPHITPAGDPSVRNDTIYKLAVNPADYADDDYVYLLDDGVLRFEPDGRGSRTYRQVVQILNQDGAEAWGEQSFSYSSGSERLTVNWIRVLKPNGDVISAQPAHEQESLAPVAFDAPVYSDEKVRRVTLSGVAPGTLVDWSYTVERVKPLVPGCRRAVIGHAPHSGAQRSLQAAGCGIPRSPRVHLGDQGRTEDSRPAICGLAQHPLGAHRRGRADQLGRSRQVVRRPFDGPLRAESRARDAARRAREGRAHAGRFIARGASVGVAGFPLRVAVPRHWRVPAADAGSGAGNALW